MLSSDVVVVVDLSSNKLDIEEYRIMPTTTGDGFDFVFEREVVWGEVSRMG